MKIVHEVHKEKCQKTCKKTKNNKQRAKSATNH